MGAWRCAMDRWPDRQFEIYRRCAADPDFRELLDDYEDACRALERWRASDRPDPRLAADYADIVRDLEREIVAILARP